MLLQRYIFILLILLCNFSLTAQTIENIDFTDDYDAKTVTITYDLVASPNHTFTVNIFCIDKITDRELGQLQALEGNNSFGNGVRAGRKKTVVWKLTEDIPSGLRSKVQFRIEAVPEAIIDDHVSDTQENYIETVNGVSFTMVYVKGGTFQMGSNDGQSDEKPAHIVRLSDFYMAETEVTQELYEAVMGNNPSRFKGKQRPVEKVSWYDAVEFCNALSTKAGRSPYYNIDKTKKDPNNKNTYDNVKWIVTINPMANGYHLHSEAQWEYAAGGGLAGTDARSGVSTGQRTKWAGTNSLDELNDYAWYYSNSKNTTDISTKFVTK